MTPAIDYQNLLFRLADKVRRQADYYRRIARSRRDKLPAAQDLEETAVLCAESESLERCAKDMDYVFERVAERLPTEDIVSIVSICLQDRKDGLT